MGSRSLIGYFSATNKPGHITPLGGNNSLYLKLLTGVQFEFEKKRLYLLDRWAKVNYLSLWSLI